MEERKMAAFRETLQECHLLDLGYSGVWYTWERGYLPETTYGKDWIEVLQTKNGWSYFQRAILII